MQEIKKNNVRDVLDKAVSSGSLHCVVGLVASKDEILFEHAAGFRDEKKISLMYVCLLYTSPSPRDRTRSRMPSSA